MGGGPNPPVRTDQYQRIVNVSWGLADVGILQISVLTSPSPGGWEGLCVLQAPDFTIYDTSRPGHIGAVIPGLSVGVEGFGLQVPVGHRAVPFDLFPLIATDAPGGEQLLPTREEWEQVYLWAHGSNDAGGGLGDSFLFNFKKMRADFPDVKLLAWTVVGPVFPRTSTILGGGHIWATLRTFHDPKGPDGEPDPDDPFTFEDGVVEFRADDIDKPLHTFETEITPAVVDRLTVEKFNMRNAITWSG